MTKLGEQPTARTAPAFNAQALPADHGRLRVSFIGDRPSLPRIGVRQVFLCGTSCVTVGSTKSVAAPDNGRGTGELFSDSAVPAMTVDRIIVKPDPSAGEVVPFKTIRLAKPINVTAGGRHELFLTVKTVQTGARKHLAVDFLAEGQMPPTATEVVAYRPDRSLKAGGHFDLAPSSMPAPSLFSMQTLETGDVTSRVAVWPKISLKKPMKVTLALNEARLPVGLTWADYQLSVGGRDVGRPNVEGAVATVTTTELGDVQLTTRRLLVQAEGQRAVAVAEPAAAGKITVLSQDTSSCRSRLKTANTEIEQLFAQGYSAVKTNACEAYAPYMHIVVINRADRDQTLYVPLVPVEGGYELRSIEQHGSGSLVAINATAWDGDYGVFAGGVGTPAWTLRTQNANRKLTSNYEAFLAFQQQPADKSRGTSAEFHRGVSANSTLSSGSTNPSVDFNTHTYHVLGSTTSIVANGVCSRSPGTERNTWSAAGIGLNRMVFASTTSYADTNDYEICAIFETLGYMNGALRLDGGGAAAMAWSGVHLNPLTGSNYMKYGDFRYLLNAMVWK